MIQDTGKDLVIDAEGLYARSYFAAVNGDLRYVDGGYFVAAFKQLFSAIRGEVGVPRRILFCFDGKSKTVKPRKPKPSGYHEGLAEFKTAIKSLFGAGSFAWHADHEADDLVATAVTRSSEQGISSVVMSGDKDLQQLKSDKIDIYCLNKKRLLTAREICERWTVHAPVEVAVALALIGDGIDGVDGVSKVGERWVQKTFDQIPSDLNLEEVVEAVKVRLNLEQQRQFMESLDLTFLYTDLDIDLVPVEFKPSTSPDLLSDRANDEYLSGLRSIDPELALSEVDSWDP